MNVRKGIKMIGVLVDGGLWDGRWRIVGWKIKDCGMEDGGLWDGRWRIVGWKMEDCGMEDGRWRIVGWKMEDCGMEASPPPISPR